MSVSQQHATGRPVIDVSIMYVTHEAFRRDLARLAAAAAAGTGTAPHVRAGWENFKHQLHIHHTVEDAELWPRVEAAAAGRPDALALLQDMEAEHARLSPLLDGVDRALRGPAGELVANVRELAAGLIDHMKHEEDSALPLIQEVLTPKDWKAFGTGMVRSQGLKGVFVYIPWVVDGSAASDRDRLFSALPKPVRPLNGLVFEPRYRKRRLWAS